ncbi:RNA polymerase sigma factor [Pseudohongiella nitratireducens]|jgi:RNA polymerase sigma-70 factor (ECF subfamily)|uniref:RNA polymerase sigma factor n=1 Tax=Pseudohongiella nitratireducens TaxID=1768907 RepID=A0A917GJL4_9GAMM|nr:RNA polymerase sigma factor RpoE [Pseudohongiella nitratireducens]MDF1622787.1 RNA polymerase sigma factor RpoE [Pseudohongiella nitratireducens]GGG49078.1 RNA polymerase sigma factor [Pseudohongiella nitratireducens]|tara:strand:+ start:5615 stop:6196 length:582 start_codon:yes stop_codon:yes gene_type:complete
MDNQETDNQLVERVLKNDTQAFTLLVLRYQHKVLGLIGRFVKDPYEAEDVAQESFLKAYRALSSFRGDSAFYTWLYRIAVNTAKNYLVSKGRRPPSTDVDVNDAQLVDDSSLLRELESPDAAMEKEDLRKVIQLAIEELPEELRTAFSLREFSGLSYEDITQVMDCPVGTVRSRIFRAREAIDKRIQEFRSAN